METREFDEIRPYNDEELPQVFEELIADEAFRKAMEVAVPEIPFDLMAAKMRMCRTKLDFQKAFCYPFLMNIIRKCTKGATLDYSALTDKQQAYTYVSNHRDIVLDSGFLSVLLIDQGMDTVEIAIGDNLLIYPWIKKLVRVNKSFIVQRALSMRQMLESSTRMSRYMHYTIGDKHQSIWIAQREGRAKDSDDRTQDSVLKMLAMGGDGDFIDRLMQMHIVPTALSYEYDPCDYLKAKEFQQKRDIEGFKKSSNDDLINMQVGILGYKGEVHFQVAPCLNEELAKLDRTLPKTELVGHVSSMIDKQIHRNYRIYSGNYVAYDLLKGGQKFATHYTEQEQQTFETYVQGQLDKIDLPKKDVPYLREKLLQMYANPLINNISAR